MKKGFSITCFVLCALCMIIAFFPIMSMTELFKQELQNSGYTQSAIEEALKDLKELIPNVYRFLLGGKRKTDGGGEINFSSTVPYGSGFIGLFYVAWFICSVVFLANLGENKTSGCLMILFNVLYLVLFFVVIATEFNIPKSFVEALSSDLEKPLKSYITFGFGFWGTVFVSVLSAVFGISAVSVSE